jgi:hypothetical protein|tara:strand:- start:2080 stop:2868 length:789 start_codon:yes stop_codon:yes gene_type:complete
MIYPPEKTWDRFSDRKEAPFVSTTEKFANSIRGVRWLQKQSVIHEAEYICNGQYTYQKLDNLNKFKDSKILIIGGGPTVNEYEWDHKGYDYIFSLHNFYQSDLSSKINIDLYLIGNQTKALSPKFLDYVDGKNTILAMEDLELKRQMVHEIQKRYTDRSLLCSCRAQFKSLGASPKLITLALSLGAKQVDCIGVDGVPKKFNKKTTEYKHAFDKTGWDKNYPHESYVDQFKLFSLYLKHYFPYSVINNLGVGHPYNCWHQIQ